jgi:hypothetical protein
VTGAGRPTSRRRWADVVFEGRYRPRSIVGTKRVKAATPARTITRGGPNWWKSSLQTLAELRGPYGYIVAMQAALHRAGTLPESLPEPMRLGPR